MSQWEAFVVVLVVVMVVVTYIQLGGQYIPLKPHYLHYFPLYNGLVLCGMNEVGNLSYGFENYRTGVDMGLAVLPGTPPHI